MSKVILIMDNPNACIDCPVHFAGACGQVWCGKDKKRLLSDDIETFKPDWCPLKEVLKKRTAQKYKNPLKSWINGWNACIDEILKEDK